MELDEIDAVALAVHDVQLGRVLVGDPAEVERAGRTIVLAAGRQAGEIEPGARGRIRQRPVGAEQVDVAEVGRLVERGVFEQAGGHRASLVRRCRRGKPASGRRHQRQSNAYRLPYRGGGAPVPTTATVPFSATPATMFPAWHT